MKRILLATTIATLIAATTSSAAAGPTVIAHGKRSAHGTKADTWELYVRGYGHHLSASAHTRCVAPRWNGGYNNHVTTLPKMSPGKLYRVSFGGNPYAWGKLSAGDCDVTATLRGTGQIRLQILAK